MRGSAGGARRRRADRVGAILAVLVGAAVLLAGCGTPSASPPSTAAEAYDAAHPSGPVPSTLQTVDLTRAQVAHRVAAIVGDAVRILLPQHLPPGFGPAAPYIAVGDGTARPNPEGWGRSYRVSYTDGRGLLVVTCGATSVPEGVIWSEDRLSIDGRPARAGQASGTIVVATDGGSPLIVVTGGRVARALLLACAASLEPWP
jgi:hypothetical protein